MNLFLVRENVLLHFGYGCNLIVTFHSSLRLFYLRLKFQNTKGFYRPSLIDFPFLPFSILLYNVLNWHRTSNPRPIYSCVYIYIYTCYCREHILYYYEPTRVNTKELGEIIIIFEKYDSDGGAHPWKTCGDPTVTRLCRVIFQKNNTYGGIHYTYYFYFFQTYYSCYRTKGFLVPFMSARARARAHNTPFIFFKSFFRIIHLELEYIYCYCRTGGKHLLSTRDHLTLY